MLLILECENAICSCKILWFLLCKGVSTILLPVKGKSCTFQIEIKYFPSFQQNKLRFKLRDETKSFVKPNLLLDLWSTGSIIQTHDSLIRGGRHNEVGCNQDFSLWKMPFWIFSPDIWDRTKKTLDKVLLGSETEKMQKVSKIKWQMREG